ncbi:hypothetical protein ES319_1Z083700v1 [Gossypium barbadense]|uniref:Non-haem dioxygenase N-terminal domain-containing protein n=1 Tax=Gossypium barbadense TaxID=3634 RepID=A0A5J5N7Z2_GOSBA|nr:hypothetical protein ES319_1Z083700v1 [Gossypium barbadense]
MGVNAKIEFPVIEFRPSDLKRGTDGWHRLCKRVREACETFGCFEVVYEKISAKVREETFELMKELIAVPVERKQKNISPLPYHGWVGPCNQVSFNTLHTMTTQIEELNKLIWEKWESVMINYKSLVRFMKYMAPPPGEYEKGLFAHTDKPVSTIICDDQVSGLEIDVNGQWSCLYLLSFCFVVGDPLKQNTLTLASSSKPLLLSHHQFLIENMPILASKIPVLA